MSLEVFRACIQGYGDRLLDKQILDVQQAYWTGYFQRAKKPKSLKSIIQNMFAQHSKEKATSTKRPDVDVDAFLEMERKFNLINS